MKKYIKKTRRKKDEKIHKKSKEEKKKKKYIKKARRKKYEKIHRKTKEEKRRKNT